MVKYQQNRATFLKKIVKRCMASLLEKDLERLITTLAFAQIYKTTTPNITDKRRANCSQTTGERLASSVASRRLLKLALA